MAKNKSEKTGITRRDLLKYAGVSVGALALGMLPGLFRRGCRKQTEFEKMINEVSEKYEIYDAGEFGKRTVFYLMDMHLPVIEHQNRQRLDYLVDRFGIPFVGVEGVVEKPNSAVRTQTSQLVKTQPEPKPGEIADELPNSYTAALPDAEGHDYVFESKKYKALGLEEPSIALNTPFIVALEECYRQQRDILLSGPIGAAIAMEVDGKPTFAEFNRRWYEEQMSMRDPTCPKLDLSKLETIMEKGQNIRFLADKHYLANFVNEWDSWEDKKCTDPRTVYGAKLLMDEMEKNDFKSAALIFGGYHALAERSVNFQSEFAKRGFSYVVLNLPPGAGTRPTPRIRKQ